MKQRGCEVCRICQTRLRPNKSLTDQSNLTKGRIAAAHGWCIGIQQVAPVCIPTKYMFPLAQPSPQPRRRLDRFTHFAQFTAVSSGMPGHVLSRKNCRFVRGNFYYMVRWAHPNPHPKRHLDRFIRFCSAQDCDISTDRQTDRQTTQRSVALGCI